MRRRCGLIADRQCGWGRLVATKAAALPPAFHLHEAADSIGQHRAFSSGNHKSIDYAFGPIFMSQEKLEAKQRENHFL
jgi:hypothetical protein